MLEGAGYSVDRQLDLASREVSDAALEAGEIDLKPEYLGSDSSSRIRRPRRPAIRRRKRHSWNRSWPRRGSYCSTTRPPTTRTRSSSRRRRRTPTASRRSATWRSPPPNERTGALGGSRHVATFARPPGPVGRGSERHERDRGAHPQHHGTDRDRPAEAVGERAADRIPDDVLLGVGGARPTVPARLDRRGARGSARCAAASIRASSRRCSRPWVNPIRERAGRIATAIKRITINSLLFK